MSKKKIKSGKTFNADTTYNCVLVIPDLHFPAPHPDAMEFLKHLRDTLQPDLVVNLGDILDHAALSFHEKNPDMPGALDEYNASIDMLDEFYSEFPTGLQVLGNHCTRALRTANANGIPSMYMKPMEDVLRVPKTWTLKERQYVKIPNGEVLVIHTLGNNDITNAQKLATSVVTGHRHTVFSIGYWSTREKLMFALTSGCLINPNHKAFGYSSNRVLRPIIGASAIVDGVPILLPMQLDKHGRWTGE